MIPFLRSDGLVLYNSLGPRYIQSRCAKLGTEAGFTIPRGIRKKSLCRTNLYHAWTADEVRTTRQIPFLPIDPDFCRKKNVRRKLNAMALEFANKNVLIVDGMFVK